MSVLNAFINDCMPKSTLDKLTKSDYNILLANMKNVKEGHPLTENCKHNFMLHYTDGYKGEYVNNMPVQGIPCIDPNANIEELIKVFQAFLAEQNKKCAGPDSTSVDMDGVSLPRVPKTSCFVNIKKLHWNKIISVLLLAGSLTTFCTFCAIHYKSDKLAMEMEDHLDWQCNFKATCKAGYYPIVRCSYGQQCVPYFIDKNSGDLRAGFEGLEETRFLEQQVPYVDPDTKELTREPPCFRYNLGIDGDGPQVRDNCRTKQHVKDKMFARAHGAIGGFLVGLAGSIGSFFYACGAYHEYLQ